MYIYSHSDCVSKEFFYLHEFIIEILILGFVIFLLFSLKHIINCIINYKEKENMIWLIGCTKKEYLESVCTSRNYLFGTSLLTVFEVALSSIDFDLCLTFLPIIGVVFI